MTCLSFTGCVIFFFIKVPESDDPPKESKVKKETIKILKMMVEPKMRRFLIFIVWSSISYCIYAGLLIPFVKVVSHQDKESVVL
jgi:hypothetical protein